ncbi:MAG: proton-conducting transporter membrane subunit [Xanthomonadales bacterium]|nr:proton-conducting transporter membrane subunit [Xanthomonadales bacterium]
MSLSDSAQLALAAPALAAVLIGLTGRWPNLRDGIALAAGGVLFAIVLSIVGPVMAGEQITVVLAEPLPGVPLSLSPEPLGVVFALVASFLWIVTTIYSIGYMRGQKEQNQTRFYACFAIAITAAVGIALAGDMLTLFLFYEVLTVSTYPLVTHRGTPETKRAGRVYLGILMGTSVGMLLLGVIWTWSISGTLTFRPGGIIPPDTAPVFLALLYGLYIFGIGKAAVMPFHRWLPAAMVAPAPVSALLHAVAVVKAGVFTVLKVTVYIFGLETINASGANGLLLWVAGATVIIASLVAIQEDNLKARLAYSTISQLGYVVLGALLATPLAIVGGTMHIAMHAFGKITLFFCAGAIYAVTSQIVISKTHGAGRVMPITMGAFFLASLSIIGLPIAGGTWSKWYLMLGALDAGQIAIMVVFMVSSILNIAYLLPIPIHAFFSKAPEGMQYDRFQEAPWPCVLAICITTAGCLALFFFPEPLYQLAVRVVP